MYHRGQDYFFRDQNQFTKILQVIKRKFPRSVKIIIKKSVIVKLQRKQKRVSKKTKVGLVFEVLKEF